AHRARITRPNEKILNITPPWSRAHSPPCKGGVAATSKRCREATFDRSGRGGQFGEMFRPEDFAELTTPSAPQPPLLFKEGNEVAVVHPNLIPALRGFADEVLRIVHAADALVLRKLRIGAERPRHIHSIIGDVISGQLLR